MVKEEFIIWGQVQKYPEFMARKQSRGPASEDWYDDSRKLDMRERDSTADTKECGKRQRKKGIAAILILCGGWIEKT